MPSFFEPIDLLPDDPILSIPLIYAKDTHPHKINLGIGVYKNEEGQSTVFKAVKKAEHLLNEHALLKDYLPIDGDKKYLQHVYELVFGDHTSVPRENVYATQTIGGTGALAIAASFLKSQGVTQIALSEPTWPNHHLIFSQAGLKLVFYPYKGVDEKLDFSELLASLERLPPKTTVLMHACCHNPTGIDFNDAQWQQLSELIKKRKLLPFFDLAYQGFGTNLEEDVAAIQYFAKQGHEMIVSVSFSKNLGLYGERVGALFVVDNDTEITKKIASHVKQTIRAHYSNPPLHGARLVSTVLESPTLKAEWQQELTGMCTRIKDMRTLLTEGLMCAQTHCNFTYLREQKGFFSCLALKIEQIALLRNEYGMYLLDNGRINIAGLNHKTIHYVVDSLVKVIQK